MNERLGISGHVRIRAHSAGYVYSRDTYRSGWLLLDAPNTIISTGRDWLAGYLLNDGVNRAYTPGISQIALYTAGSVERYKADITDRYTSGSNAIAVLYVPTVAPSGQPYTFNEARLFTDTAGATYLAQKTGINVIKNSSLGLTVEWTITLT